MCFDVHVHVLRDRVVAKLEKLLSNGGPWQSKMALNFALGHGIVHGSTALLVMKPHIHVETVRFVVLFLFPGSERHLLIRDKVTRRVKDAKALPAPSCRCNVSQKPPHSPTPHRCRSSSHWNIPRARCSWSRKILFQNQSFKGSSFEVNSRSYALTVDSCKAELLFSQEQRTVRPTNAARPVVWLGIASSRLHHRVTARRKCTQLARVVDFQKRQVLRRKAHEIYRHRFPYPGALNCVNSDQTAHSK